MSSTRIRSPASVRWLGYDWGAHRYHASDYYDVLYEFAEWFVAQGLAYVDSQSADEMRATRGTLTAAGHRRPLSRSQRRREPRSACDACAPASFPTARMCCACKIDMASPNINLRDPAIYRIRHARTTAPATSGASIRSTTTRIASRTRSSAITHSICTLEFQDHRPLYDWVIEKLADGGQLARPLPQQYEFARLNLTYVVLSKRKLIELVEERPRRRLGRSADADARRRAAARLHAGGLPDVRRAHRRVEVRLVDRHERARRDCMRDDLNAQRACGASPCSIRSSS